MRIEPRAIINIPSSRRPLQKKKAGATPECIPVSLTPSLRSGVPPCHRGRCNAAHTPPEHFLRPPIHFSSQSHIPHLAVPVFPGLYRSRRTRPSGLPANHAASLRRHQGAKEGVVVEAILGPPEGACEGFVGLGFRFSFLVLARAW